MYATFVTFTSTLNINQMQPDQMADTYATFVTFTSTLKINQM